MRAGALFAAVAIQSSSAVAVELYEERISQVLLAFFLLSLAALMQIMRREPTARMATGLGLAAAATALVYWYSGLFLLLTAAIVLWAHSDKLNESRWKMLGLSAVIGLGITLPFAIDRLADLFRGCSANCAIGLVEGKTLLFKRHLEEV